MSANLDSYQLKWHSHANHLNGSVAALLRSERFTDVVLCTLDGCQVPAHKFILNSCSIYLSSLFESQRTSLRLGNSVVYVVLPAEITTKALHILIEYMYKGETTVSNDILDTVLKAGDLLKIRGLWRQNDGKNDTADRTTDAITKQIQPKKPDATETQLPKISVKKDEKLLKTYAPVQHLNISRQSFIGPPKLVFIKTSDGNTGLRALAPKPAAAPQTIIVTPDLQHHINLEIPRVQEEPEVVEVNNAEAQAKAKKCDKKYGKRMKNEAAGKEVEPEKMNVESEAAEEPVSQQAEEETAGEACEMDIKPEPDWEDDGELPPNMDDLFHAEMTIKSEVDHIPDDMEEEEQVYSPLTCELCFEIFHVPAEWVRHIQKHAECTTEPPTRKRKSSSANDDSEETALLRCDLCQKHFPNPAEWVRHIQSAHTETELAMCNNSSPPRRHNSHVLGSQKKTCDHCKKVFPSHASMVIHLRTHTGERPFVCGHCNKGFNVKSNLLRHLRTLHDTIISPGSVALLQDDVILPTTDSIDPLASTSAAPKDYHEENS